MRDFLSIGEAAKRLGVSEVTLRRWEKSGKLLSAFRTIGDHRRFAVRDVLKLANKHSRINVCYARVSSHDQKKDLATQSDFLTGHCREQGIRAELIQDLGSGLNFKKKGLNRLLALILSGAVDTIYVSNKDRLLRFGSELLVSISRFFGTRIVFLSEDSHSFEQALARDVLEIITVFSAKLYGARSHQKKRALQPASI
jgi:putative resolvase